MRLAFGLEMSRRFTLFHYQCVWKSAGGGGMGNLYGSTVISYVVLGSNNWAAVALPYERGNALSLTYYLPL